MCGRFTLRTSARAIAEHFGLADAPHLEPRYNIAPTQSVPVVRLDTSDDRELAMMHWGLIPSWAKDPKIGNRQINARSETAATMPSFRSAFKWRRCLVVADGFFEWKGPKGQKQPYLIDLGGGPFAFAGLWERWVSNDDRIESCTVLTTVPNNLMETLHDRMPVILSPSDYDSWLGPEKLDRLESLLCPYPSEEMRVYPVSKAVNRPTNDAPECVEPIEV